MLRRSALAVVRGKAMTWFDGGDEHASAADGGRGADRSRSSRAKVSPEALIASTSAAPGRKNVALNGDRRR
jgi:hypothetical protein